MPIQAILAIETSCDETAAAVVADGRRLLANVISSQIDLHRRFGGVVPEIASRSHQEVINPVIDEALEQAGLKFGDLAALAVTQGPGLPGALMIGMATAKAIAYATARPLVGVNHLEGHIFANLLEHPDLKPPFIALVVSGGHTLLAYVPDWGDYRVLGQTLDDAAGEAFDKIAKFLDLGYPGGPVISRLAEQGNPESIAFPRAMIRTPDYDFSLSGLKTAVLNYVTRERAAGREVPLPDLAASFQAAVIDVQIHKTLRAVEEFGVDKIVLAGGVAANRSLRERLATAGKPKGYRLYYPSLMLCTDNAAMIATAAHLHYQRKQFLGLDAEPLPDMELSARR